MKRLALSLLFVVCCTLSWAGSIATSKDLVAFINALNAGQPTDEWRSDDGTVLLTADIDLSKEKKFASMTSFGGILDGQGHSITGWAAKAPLIVELLPDGEVRNLVIDASCNAKLTSKAGEYFFGFVVGINRGKVANCKNYGSIDHKCNFTADEIYIGGVVGSNRAYVLNCSNYGRISTVCGTIDQKAELPISLGGVVGGSYGKEMEGSPVVAYCVNEGIVKASTDFPCENIGGVVGSGLKMPVKFCVNRGEVLTEHVQSLDSTTPGQVRVGGVVGFTKMDVVCCDNFGTVTADGQASVSLGGIVGFPHAALVVGDCVNYGLVKSLAEGVSCMGGIVGNMGRPVHVRRCMNRGEVFFDGACARSRSSVGGIVGGIYTKKEYKGAYVRNCTNYGSVHSNSGGNKFENNDSGIHTAGIVGYFGGHSAVQCILADCQNFGKIQAATGRRAAICAAAPYVNMGGNCPNEEAASAEPLADGSNVYGHVTSTDGSPVEGVVVSDGRNCVTTDSEGAYRMTSDLAEARFVYISIPSGYRVTTYAGIPRFYRRIARYEKAVSADFVLAPKETQSDRYTVMMVADPQVRPYDMDNSMEAWRDVVAPDIEKTRAAIGGDVYSINLGDLVYNYMYAYDDYLDVAGTINCPTFNVMGNHDYDQTTLFNSDLGNMFFDMYVGPQNYSFNLGQIHYVIVSDITYDRPNSAANYGDGLEDRTMEWLENDLKFVPKDKVVMLCGHAQLFKKRSGSWCSKDRNYDRYFPLLASYKKVYTWAGHYHSNFQFNYADKGFLYKGVDPVDNIVCTTVSRATGALRFNRHINTNGAPQGYVVMSVDGENVEWYYKGCGMDGSQQMSVFSPLRTGDGFVKANVWNYGDGWSTPAWYENGVKVADMELHPELDPDYVDLYATFTHKTNRKYCTPSEETYMFRATPSEGCTSGEIRVTDQFGHEYVKTIAW